VFRTIKITAGMTSEFEIIYTAAPDEVIEEQLRENAAREENGISIEDAYDLIKEKGYEVDILGCQDMSSEELEKIVIDAEFDYYEYYE